MKHSKKNKKLIKKGEKKVMEKNGVYVWKVKVYSNEADWGEDWYYVPTLSRIFTNKLAALDYAFKMQQKRNDNYNYYDTRIVKWFGN